MILFHLFFVLRTTIRPEVRILTDLFLLFAHDHSTEKYDPLIFNLSFVRPFDQDLGTSLIYFFSLYTTIRQKYMVPFHLIFLLYTTIRPKIRVFIDLFLSCAHDHSTEICGFHIFFVSFVHEHLTKT